MENWCIVGLLAAAASMIAMLPVAFLVPGEHLKTAMGILLAMFIIGLLLAAFNLPEEI